MSVRLQITRAIPLLLPMFVIHQCCFIKNNSSSNFWQSELLSQRKLQELFRGTWYVSAGLNPAFDTFDCQMHEFDKPQVTKKKKNGNSIPIADATFSYRIKFQENTNEWLPRTGTRRLTLVYNNDEDSSLIPNEKHRWQGFDTGLKWGIDSFLIHENPNQVKSNPAASSSQQNVNKQQLSKTPRLVLTLRPDMLKYQDDWIVLQSSPESYIVLLYRGTNSAWEGYGGLNVYTRTRSIPLGWKHEIERDALSKVNLRFSDLTLVDNSCPPPPPALIL